MSSSARPAKVAGVRLIFVLIGHKRGAPTRRKPKSVNCAQSEDYFAEVILGHGTRDLILELRDMIQREMPHISALDEGCSVNGKESSTPNSASHVASQGASGPGTPPLLHSGWTRISRWSGSAAKRAFDCGCVLLVLPLLIPVITIVGLAVRLTSRGPVLFVQRRMGRHGKTFCILKFRTMTHIADRAHHTVTTAVNQRFTLIGPFLRRWKLDELPQLLNVLAGHMSLVGPRPKLPEHVVAHLPCRPGVTGAATLAFAREEAMLARIPQHQVEDYYHVLVLPAKRYLDAAYMAQATFLSDLKLIAKTLLRRWDDSIVRDLLVPENLRRHEAMRRPHVYVAPVSHPEAPPYAVAVENASEGVTAI